MWGLWVGSSPREEGQRRTMMLVVTKGGEVSPGTIAMAAICAQVQSGQCGSRE